MKEDVVMDEDDILEQLNLYRKLCGCYEEYIENLDCLEKSKEAAIEIQNCKKLINSLR